MNLLKKSILPIGRVIVPKSMKGIASRWFYKLNNLYKYGTTDFFQSIEIETITTCNRKCLYCPNSKYTREKGEMSMGLWKKIVNDLAELKYQGRLSPHFYVEPLLDKRMQKIIYYARKKLPKAELVIFSNGDFLTKELFDKLIVSGVDSFVITQHQKTMTKTMKDLFESLNEEEKKKIEYQVYTDETVLSNRGGLVNPRTFEAKKNCTLPTDFSVVNYKGEVILCCNDYLSTIVWGNLKKEKLIDIWNKEEYKKTRKKLFKGVIELDICERCTLVDDKSLKLARQR